MAIEGMAFEGLEGTLLIIQIVVSLYTLIYSYDVLFLHRYTVERDTPASLQARVIFPVSLRVWRNLFPHSLICRVRAIFFLPAYASGCPISHLLYLFTSPDNDL